MKDSKTRKREKNMATEKIDMTDLFDKFLATYKQTHVSVNGQQAQIECSRPWREIKKEKENAAAKSEAQKLMLHRKMDAKKPGKGSIINFFTKAATKKGGLFINMFQSHQYLFTKVLQAVLSTE